MRGWFRRHPLLAVTGLVFFGVLFAVALAVYASSSQTITPQESRRRPTIAGASPVVAGTAEVAVIPVQPVTENQQLGKLPLFFFQTLIVGVGIAASVYVTMLVTGNF